MFGGIRSFLREKSELKRFQSLPAREREQVFYAESAADWPHFEPILRDLTRDSDRKICYVTSDSDDPVLTAGRPGLIPFYMGSGMILTIFFKSLDCRVLVMTLTDLETFHLKRSVHQVHYVYVFHSINSTHMVYRKGAFDAYDTILCVGPHHKEELRKNEAVYGLKPKRLLEGGYGRLDTIIAKYSAKERPLPSQDGTLQVVLAPSWGESSFIEQACGRELITALLRAGIRVLVRLHPMTVRRMPKLGTELTSEFGTRGQFEVITDMSEQDSLHTSHVMVSDWSGAAFEFAFGLERPVLFVNTSRKLRNPEYEKIGLPPLEATIRTEIGDVIAPAEIASAPQKIQKLAANPTEFTERLRNARQKWIYNVGRSGAVGGNVVRELLRPRVSREVGHEV